MSSPVLTSPCSFGSGHTSPFVVERLPSLKELRIMEQNEQIEDSGKRIAAARQLLIEVSDPSRVSDVQFTYKGVIHLDVFRSGEGKVTFEEKDHNRLTIGQQVGVNALLEALHRAMRTARVDLGDPCQNLEEAVIVAGRACYCSLWLNDQALQFLKDSKTK